MIIKYLISPLQQNQRIRYWCSDETRLGLKTIGGRVITLKGVKPLGMTQWSRKNFYLYGAVEPLTGESFFLEFSHVDAVCFQTFLEKLADAYSKEVHIIQVDNGTFHQSQYLTVPKNIILLFQPPNTPEVNPIERLWLEIKRMLRWECFKSLQELRAALKVCLDKLSKEVIASITGWGFITDALYVSGIS